MTTKENESFNHRNNTCHDEKILESEKSITLIGDLRAL